MAESDLVQSLLRGMLLLRLAARHPEGMRLSELAEAANLQKTTAYNLLRTLCAGKFLVKDSCNRFILGPAVYELAGAADSDLIKRAGAAMYRVYESFPGDILTFSTLDVGMARCKLRFSPDRPGEIQHPENRTFPPYISVSSLALQAAAPHKSDIIEQLYPFEDYGESFWGSWLRFSEAKAEALQLGYCWKQSEGRFSAAFIMPDGYVLGFGGEGSAETEVPKRHEAAKFFRRKVWQK